MRPKRRITVYGSLLRISLLCIESGPPEREGFAKLRALRCPSAEARLLTSFVRNGMKEFRFVVMAPGRTDKVNQRAV